MSPLDSHPFLSSLSSVLRLTLLWAASGLAAGSPLSSARYFGEHFYGSNGVCLSLHIHDPYAQVTNRLISKLPLTDINLAAETTRTPTQTQSPGLGVLGRHVHTAELAVARLHRRVVREDAEGDPGLRRGDAQHAERSRERGGQTVSEISAGARVDEAQTMRRHAAHEITTLCLPSDKPEPQPKALRHNTHTHTHV